MLTYSSYGAWNRHLGGPATDAGETPSPLDKLLLNSRENRRRITDSAGLTCWNLHLLRREPYQLPSQVARTKVATLRRGLAGRATVLAAGPLAQWAEQRTF